jgi:sulfhydrogenase subunit alpha
MTNNTATRTIKVDMLARVEGEGALDLHIEGGQVKRARLVIFEPPRFFEALLRGRGCFEAPDITARICGICPVAYQMSSAHAMEQACGVKVEGQLRALRRMIYCGEWIESHALHIVLLHAPDFLGYADGIEMAREHGDVVAGGLALKKAGNELVRVLGGREIHPVNARVGGFYRAPARKELAAVEEDIKRGRDTAVKVLRWVSGFEFPDFERNYEFVSLRHPAEYPIDEGRIVSSGGLDIAVDCFEDEFEERHMAHSNALHSVIRERGAYLVGPLGRYALNFDRLPGDLQSLAREAGLGEVCRNPFMSIMVRAVELIYACDEALRLIADYRQPDAPYISIEPRAGRGCGATEAPRGMLYHRYVLDDDGSILEARIVPPTAQNQPSIEGDLLELARRGLDLPDDALRQNCELAIRNYDPCISCSAHFLKLSVHRA